MKGTASNSFSTKTYDDMQKIFRRQTQSFRSETTKDYISPRQLSKEKLSLKSYMMLSSEKPKTLPIHQRLRSKFGVAGVSKDTSSHNGTQHAVSSMYHCFLSRVKTLKKVDCFTYE